MAAVLIAPARALRASINAGHRSHGLAGLALIAAPALGFAQPAWSQSATTLVPPVISPDYRRDRNISVLERPHPDFDPLGYRFGGFVVNPSLTLSPGITSNVYTDNGNKRGDVFMLVEPVLRVASDWSVHRVLLEARGDIRRYAKAQVRNQNGWNVEAAGRLDISQDLVIEANAQAGRRFESPFSDDVISNTTNISSYLQTAISAKATYMAGRTRLTGALDRTTYAFNRVTFADRPARDQSFRDRTSDRLTAIGEYALSPSLSIYGEVVLDRNDYSSRLINGDANRDGTGYALILGANFDLAGLMRGAVGAGYSRRDYKSSLYPDASGLSVQGKVEFFPTPLTTVGVTAQRQIQDAGLGGAGAYWDNRATIRIDHELLENLILTLDADVARRSYLESNQLTDVWSAGGGARFQMTRGLSLGGNIRYGSSRPSGDNLGNPFDEFRAIVSIRIRR